MAKDHHIKRLISTTLIMMLLMNDWRTNDNQRKLLWRRTQEMSQHLPTINEDCKTLRLQWKVNSQRKEIILHLLTINLKRKRSDLIINQERRILIMMILKNQRLITTEAILTIIEQNSTLNSQETQQALELQIQLFSSTQIGTKLSFTNYSENVTIKLNLQTSVSKTMENSILMKIYSLNLENWSKLWEYFQRNTKTEQNNSKMQTILKLPLKPSTNRTLKT